MPSITIERLAELPQSEAHPPAESLARIAANLKVIAGVLAEYPQRNPDAWNSPGWEKELRDLHIACERLNEYARRMEDLSARLVDGRVDP